MKGYGLSLCFVYVFWFGSIIIQILIHVEVVPYGKGFEQGALQSQKSPQLSRNSRHCFTLRFTQKQVNLAIQLNALASGVLNFGMHHI